MNRRNFVKGLTIGAGSAVAVTGTIPLLAFSDPGKRDEYVKPVSQDRKTPVETILNSQKVRNGVAIGGIGTGSAELRADGIFYKWQIFNNRPRGTGKLCDYTPDSMLFFVIRYQVEGEEPRLKLLSLDNGEEVASITNYNAVYIYPWITSVEKIETEVRFPFVKMKFIDSQMPVDFEMEVFSPFIPGDVKNSALPAMLFSFKVKSKTDKPVTVTLVANYRNGVGYDSTEKLYTSELKQKTGFVLNNSSISGIAETESSFGSQSLASLADNTTWRIGWEHTHPHYEDLLRNTELPNIDTTNPVPEKGGRNYFNRSLGKVNGGERSFSSLAITRNLKPTESFEHKFVYSWNFPNLYNSEHTRIEGNYYSNFFKNSGEVAEYVIANFDSLRKRSLQFVDDLFASTLEPVILNQVNGQFNTFITSAWLTKKGEFGVLEGMNCSDSCCGINTIDVSMYATQLIVSLFPDLQKESMRVHRDLQQPDGMVAHSYNKDFTRDSANAPDVTKRLDVAMQYAILVLRDFMWTNDRAYLKEMWPSVKKAMDYMLTRDLNSDQMPDMSGIMCSYDNFPMYGLASYIHSQWLCALSMCIEGAKVMNDTQAETQFKEILDNGKRLLGEKIWNGSYFRLYHTDQTRYKTEDGTGVEVEVDVPAQDEGCLTDQLIGQWVSNMSGLGYLTDKGNIKTALKTIMAMSFTPDTGLRNCTWPEDKFLHDIPWSCWVDQANTPWTGVELAFASFLIYEGLTDEALKVVRSVESRYRRAGLYWNHQECGGHYYRAMSAWTILNAYLGLSINQDKLGFAPKIQEKEYKILFAVNGATAHFICKKGKYTIQVRSGKLNLQKLQLAVNMLKSASPKVSIAGSVVNTIITNDVDSILFDFGAMQTVEAGNSIEIV